MVLVWQNGFGSEAIWGIEATRAITVEIPIVVFAFLFGISMDYQVFIVSRMREAYDRTGSTPAAVVEGIGRTGRLVTSAALILGLAFVAFSAGPGTEVKIFGTALGGGILLDATIIRGDPRARRRRDPRALELVAPAARRTRPAHRPRVCAGIGVVQRERSTRASQGARPDSSFQSSEIRARPAHWAHAADHDRSTDPAPLHGRGSARLRRLPSAPAVARYQSWDTSFSLADAQVFLAEQEPVSFGQPGQWVQVAAADRTTGGAGMATVR